MPTSHGRTGSPQRNVGADWIAVGHHRDDQVETILLRLLFGTGLTGLGAIGMLVWLASSRGAPTSKRMAIFVSRYDHCLYDLLLRHRAGETWESVGHEFPARR